MKLLFLWDQVSFGPHIIQFLFNMEVHDHNHESDEIRRDVRYRWKFSSRYPFYSNCDLAIYPLYSSYQWAASNRQLGNWSKAQFTSAQVPLCCAQSCSKGILSCSFDRTLIFDHSTGKFSYPSQVRALSCPNNLSWPDRTRKNSQTSWLPSKHQISCSS